MSNVCPSPGDKGFIYSGGAFTELLPDGWNFARALAINDNGVVAGWGSDGTTHKGFIYSAGNYTELLPDGWKWALAIAINDKGVVAGWGVDSTNTVKGFIATPPKFR